MVGLITAALWVKLLGTILRYVVTFHGYGAGDALDYDRTGARIAAAFRQGQFQVAYGHGGAGSRFMQFTTGWIYTVIGPSKVGACIVFSWLSFLGLYLFYKGFRLAFPDGDHHRYAVLIFFLPSLVYWPSIMGKEAWMTLGLGTSAYGIARLLTRQRGAFLLTGVGLWATAMVRPHVTLLLVVSLFAGYLLRRSTTRAAKVTKLAGLVVLLLGTFVLLSHAQGFFGLDKLNADTAGSVLDTAQRQSGEGGSVFAGHRVRTPIDLPVAAVTVLFRPFAFEAHSVQTGIAAMEGMTLAVICLGSLGRLRRLPRQLVRTSYVAFAATFTLVFIVAFSTINNFGILARERVQLFPLFLVLLCVPLVGTPRPPEPRAASALERPRFRPARRVDSYA